jgi:predicted nucleic acid-binding protein
MEGGIGPMVNEIRQKSRIIPLDTALARKAGAVRRDLLEGGLGDAIIYATALQYQARVLTGDPHFRDLPEVVFLGR